MTRDFGSLPLNPGFVVLVPSLECFSTSAHSLHDVGKPRAARDSQFRRICSGYDSPLK
jgi:hypothetical protein